MKKLISYALMAACLAPSAASASGIAIDSMIGFTKNGVGKFTVTNTAEYRQFIQIAISDIEIKNGQLVKTPYTRENINQWSMNARPARAVIEPGLKKDFQFSYEPKVESKTDQDHIYQFTFVPTPYFPNGEKEQSTMQVAIGFAPVVIVPAEEDQPISFDIKSNGDKLQIKNNGKTYLRAHLDTCSATATGVERKQCTDVVYVLSGRDLNVPLADVMQNKPMKVTFSTHEYKYKDTISLPVGAKLSK